MGGKNNFIVVTDFFHLGKISLVLVLREYIKIKNLPHLYRNFIMKTYIRLNFNLLVPVKDLPTYRRCMV